MTPDLASKFDNGAPPGAPSHSRWRMTPARWLIIGRRYCPTFELAMSAVVATDAQRKAAVLEHDRESSLSSCRSAKQRAARVMVEFKSLARKQELEADSKGWAAKGRDWQLSIEAMTQLYDERNRTKSTKEWIASVAEAAQSLACALEQPIEACSKTSARAYVMPNLRHFANDPPSLEDIAALAHALSRAAQCALTDADDSGEDVFASGSSFGFWVNHLRAFCRRNGLPRGAGHMPLVSGRYSEFVEFVAALLRVIPKHLRRYDESKGTLAREIGAAADRSKDFAAERERLEELEDDPSNA